MVGILVIFALGAVLITAVLLGGLPSRIAWFAFPLAVPIIAVLVLLWTFIRIVRRKRLSGVEAATIIVGLLALYPITWVRNGHPIPYPSVEERIHPSLAVRLPLEGPVRVIAGGNDKSVNHHIVFPQTRWAYDLAIDPNPDELVTPPPALNDFGCWEAPVVAPVGGQVATAHDGDPDNPPGPRSIWGPGNFVDIEVGSTGTHVIIMHLRSGSVRVTTGQHVAEGDTLGLCGSSGRSSIPHVHIHHQREPWHPTRWFLAEGLPLRFRDYHGDPNPRGGGSMDQSSKWRWTGSILEHRR